MLIIKYKYWNVNINNKGNLKFVTLTLYRIYFKVVEPNYTNSSFTL